MRFTTICTVSRAAALLAALACPSAAGAELACAGVLGNSGEQGKSLVRFAPQPCRGIGAVYDRFGSLWDRAGKGALNRYAPDGRLLAWYRIPAQEGNSDKITLAGDTLVLLLGGQLYTLDVSAPPESEAKPLKVEAQHLSFGVSKGRVACVDRQGKLFFLDPKSGAREESAAPSFNDVGDLELAENGTAYVLSKWRLHAVADGKVLSDGWPKEGPGERIQLLGGAWFGHAWHGTIRRFSADLQPDPGVVLGGASGSFIGHLDQNSDLINGRGMARLTETLYAVGGLGGILHLLEWRGEKRQMEIVRRIGALPCVNGVGLDGSRRVWCVAGSWEWTDRPDTPLRCGVNSPEYPGVGQAVMLENDLMVAPGLLWGKPTLYAGPLDKEVKTYRYEKDFSLRKDFCGTAAYKDGGKLVLLVVTKKGAAQACEIASNGEFRADLGEVTLQTTAPVKEWTSLAMKDAGVLLAAGDGQVLEFARDGKNWKETKRWNSWGGGGAGAEEKFGARIWITADTGRVWVSDRERHRVVAFDAASGKPLATFGKTDQKGTDLGTLAEPQVIAARGERAVVYDSGNQRLVKLVLR